MRKITATKNWHPENTITSNDGGNIKWSRSKNGTLSFTYDTVGLEDGYYTSWIGWQQEQKCNKNMSLILEIKAKTDALLNINLGLTKDHAVKAEDNQYVFLLEQGHTLYQAVRTEYGTFAVPKGFDGRIVVPLSNITGIGKNTTLRNVAITCTQSEDKNTSLKITNIWFSNDSDFRTNAVLTAPVQTLTQVEIPTIGEYQYNLGFLAEFLPRTDVIYRVTGQEDFITVDASGIMTVRSGAAAEKVQLQAIVNETMIYSFELELVEPWYVQQHQEEFAVPAVNQVIHYSDPVSTLTGNILKRSMAHAAALFVLYLVLFWILSRKRIRKNGN